QSDFLRREEDNAWKNLLYYPEVFGSESRNPIVLKDKTFCEVSFKDTDIKNIRFINCKFVRCLLIGATVNDCEFTDCTFEETNTSNMKIRRCLFDPTCFVGNFD